MLEKQAAFNKLQGEAAKAYATDQFRDPDQKLPDWAVTNYPALAVAQNDRNGAAGAYDQIMAQINGAGYQGLQTDLQQVGAACSKVNKSA